MKISRFKNLKAFAGFMIAALGFTSTALMNTGCRDSTTGKGIPLFNVQSVDLITLKNGVEETLGLYPTPQVDVNAVPFNATRVEITFDQDIQEATLNIGQPGDLAQVMLTNSDGSQMFDATIAMLGTNGVSVTPDQPLTPGTTYNVQIKNGITSTSNAVLAGSGFTFEFTTSTQRELTLVSITPSNGSTIPKATTEIRALFSEPVAKTGIESFFELRDWQGDLVPGTAEVNPNKITEVIFTIDPSVVLEYTLSYFFKVLPGLPGLAKDCPALLTGRTSTTQR